MTKQELIMNVADRSGCNEYEVRKVVDAMIEEMTDSLNNGEEITFRNFGTFKIKKRAPKSVRNINTGEQYTIGAKKRVVFQPGKNLK